MIFDNSCYGLKSSAARFHEHLSLTLRGLRWKLSKADLDLWYKWHEDHYDYLEMYMDDLLVWSKDLMKMIMAIKETYELKGIGYPEYYLGGDLLEIQDPHFVAKNAILALSAWTYIKNTLTLRFL